MDAVFEVDGSFGAPENTDIKHAGIDKGKILHDLLQTFRVIAVVLKNHHIVLHSRNPG